MHFDTGDTAWILVASALVLLMTPGLAFFYGGMVRGKNVLGMLAQNYVTMGVVSVLWITGVYSLAFSGTGKYIGDFHQFGLNHIWQQATGFEALTIPPLVFCAFQLMFAIITPALITGGTADRIKFGSWTLLSGLWLIVVYAPVAHWVFSPSGWLFKLGALDFAGGTVVHANAGAAALAVVLVIGKRKGWPKERMRPHNVPFVLLGAGLLWFGWFGFNAGSALGANTLSAFAFVNTNTATGAALLAWLLTEKIRDGHATTLGAASGAVAGLVAITPACGFVSPMGSIIIGFAAGIICCLAVGLKNKFKFDDALDVVGVHLVGGVLGALLIGLFATKMTNSAGANGVFYKGGWTLMGHQAVAVAAVVAYSFVATYILAQILDKTIGLRVNEEAEATGLDLSQHGETAYDTTSYSDGSRSLSAISTAR
ncbi:MAG: ammonium transporter [Actinobacteria bacterium]|nr:ammonium transporter [Actinomycetota bacterium]